MLSKALVSNDRRPSDLDMLNAFWAREPARRVLPNGLTLLVQRDVTAPVASVQVWVKTGSIHEGAYLGSGISHYLEHLLFKGTTRRAGREISASVQAHGGNINAYTTFDRTVYYIDLPSAGVDFALELLADMVLHSTLPPEEVTREKEVILREIAMGRDDPEQRLGETIFDTAFRQHPYRHPIIGHRDVFSSLTREDLLAYYQTRYVPNNLVVVVAGEVEEAAVVAAVEKHFGEAPRARLAPVLWASEPLQLGLRRIHRQEDVELTRAALAWPIPGLTHGDAPALDMLALLLGQGDSSVLWLALREEQRLVHTISTMSWNPGEGGLFYLELTCEAAKCRAALAGVQTELNRILAEGFTEAQIAKAVRQMVVSEINSRKTISGQAARLGMAEVVLGDQDFSRGYFARLAAVDDAALRRVAREYLVSSRLTEVVLSPRDAAAAPTATAQTAIPRPAFALEIQPNGARLLLQPSHHLPNVHLRLLLEGGPHTEPPQLRGITSLLTTLLTRDTEVRSGAAVAEAIEAAGGSFYPFAGNNSCGLALEVLPGDLPLALQLLTEAIYQPAFAVDTLDIEREAQLAELQQAQDDVVTLGRKLLRKKFFGQHPLAVDSQGEEAGLLALGPDDLRAYWQQLCVAGNVVLVITGDFQPAEQLPALRALLGRLPAGKRPPSSAGLVPDGVAQDWVEPQPREQAVVYQAFPGPGLLSPDFMVGEVADELFSGMSSRLFERVREEKGLAYFVRSSRVTGLHTGMFSFFAGTAPATAAAVLAEIDAEIERVQAGGVTSEELTRCQVRLQAARSMSLQTNSARAMHAGLNLLYGLPVDDAADYERRLHAVTVADLQTFALKRFQRSLRTQLIVQPPQPT